MIEKYIVKKSKEGSVKVGKVDIDMSKLKRDYAGVKAKAKKQQHVGGYRTLPVKEAFASPQSNITLDVLDKWDEYILAVYPSIALEATIESMVKTIKQSQQGGKIKRKSRL